jgi:hypothetical protein
MVYDKSLSDSSTQISVILILVILDTTEAYDYFNGTLHALVQLDQFLLPLMSTFTEVEFSMLTNN